MTAVLLALLIAAADAAPVEKAVVMPLRVLRGDGSEVRAAASGVERAFHAALARHAPYHVLTPGEIAALLTEVQRRELAGCDAEGCLAELGGALGARWLVSLSLDVGNGLWSLQATLIDQASATVVRRASVRARGVAALIDSVDQIARQLAAGARQSLTDPALRQKLGTSEEGVALLRASSTEDADVQKTWTRIILEHNRESERFAVVEGLAVLLGGLVVAVCASVPGIAVGVFYVALVTWSNELHPDDPDTLASRAPVIPLVVALVAPGFVALGAAAVAVVFGTLLLVDARNIGRIPAAKEGCCRDELELQEATAPGPGQRLAPFLAAMGGVLALLSPCCFVACERSSLVGIACCWLPSAAYGPSVPVNDVESVLSHNLLRSYGLVGALLFSGGYTAFAAAAAVVLAWAARSDVVDAARE